MEVESPFGRFSFLLVPALVRGVAEMFLREEVMRITRLTCGQRGFCVSELTPKMRGLRSSLSPFSLKQLLIRYLVTTMRKIDNMGCDGKVTVETSQRMD